MSFTSSPKMSQPTNRQVDKLKSVNPYKLVFPEVDDELCEINRSGGLDRLLENCSDFEYESCYSGKCNQIDEQYDSRLDKDKLDMNNNALDNLQKYNKHKRRQLPEIPRNLRPLGKLISSESKKNKIIKQISTTLSLQIELNENRKPISLQLINNDNDINLKPFDVNKLKSESNCLPLSEELMNQPNNATNQLVNTTKNSNKIDGNYRGLHKFIAKHDDEIDIDVGDSIYVIKQDTVDDTWFKGINLATNTTGYFPSLYVIDCSYNELFQTVNYFDLEDDDSGLNCECSNDYDCRDWMDNGKQCFQVHKERFHLEFLGSLEVLKAKGNDVLEQCIRKVIQTHLKQPNQLRSFVCILEIDNFGIRFKKNRQPPNESSTQRKNSALSDIIADNKTGEYIDDQITLDSESLSRDDSKDKGKEDSYESYDKIDVNFIPKEENDLNSNLLKKINDEMIKSKKICCKETINKNEIIVDEIKEGYVKIEFAKAKSFESKNECLNEKKKESSNEIESKNSADHNLINLENNCPINKQRLSKQSPTKQITSTPIKESPIQERMMKTNSQNSINDQSQVVDQSTKLEDDYFFDLKNVSFCGSQDNYFTFITKHPKLKQKYACHVFNSQSVQVSKMICESLGKAFHSYYLNYIELSQNFSD